jgi:double-stranded uracil-DNA glycosylase
MAAPRRSPGFTRPQLESFRGARVDDLIADPLRLLFVGINPGLWTAAVNTHFARPGNRFWPALHLAGITPHEINAGRGLSDSDRQLLLDGGIGITNLVPFATARADELTPAQVRAGVGPLTDLVGRTEPRVVAVLGITAYRETFGDRSVTVGRQPRRLAGAELWALPNPSGLNAHETVHSLAAAYRDAARAAGVLPESSSQGA